MIFVSEPKTTPPETYRNYLHQKVYDTLQKLGIPFYRVDNDDAITMDDCASIAEKLDTPIVKTLLLCNRQQTDFYLFVTTADKPFSTKYFSRAMGISRVSFASPEQLDRLLGTKVGATSVLSLLHDPDGCVKLAFDRQAIQAQWYGCTDTTTTGYMKVPTADLFDKFLPYTAHTPVILDLDSQE